MKIKKGSIKYYVAKGIIGCGNQGIDPGIRGGLIHNAFGNVPGATSGYYRLRDLGYEYERHMKSRGWTLYQTAYEYDPKKNRFHISDMFLFWLKLEFGK
jgi:hypothetical protein